MISQLIARVIPTLLLGIVEDPISKAYASGNDHADRSLKFSGRFMDSKLILETFESNLILKILLIISNYY